MLKNMKQNNTIRLIGLLLLSTVCLNVINGEENNSYRLGFGSCLDESKPQKIWSAIQKEDINDFFFLGDNVYGDSDSGELVKMRTSYEQQELNFPEWLKKLKPLAIWDDHDYGINDGGSEYKLKRESQELFLKFWKVSKKNKRF